MDSFELSDRIAGVRRTVLEAEKQREELARNLEPYIDKFFTKLIAETRDPELRRGYAFLNQSKEFKLVNDTTLRFYHSRLHYVSPLDVTVSELLKSNHPRPRGAGLVTNQHDWL